jgi:hypothetical protein
MKRLTYILIFIIFQIGCTDLKSEFGDWQKIKDKKDFAAFFNFALKTNDSELLMHCYDSLEKYRPEKYCIVLSKYEYYLPKKDSIYSSAFYKENHCGVHYDYKNRNILRINIDKKDSVISEYNHNDFNAFDSILFTLLDTSAASLKLPEVNEVIINDNVYYAKNFGVILHSAMFPDSLIQKTSWSKLIEITKQILGIYKDIRDKKSIEIYNQAFSELNLKGRKEIIQLIPIFITIKFYANVKPPPLPPPPK